MEREKEFLLRNSLSESYKLRIIEIQNKVEPLLARTTNANPTFTEYTIKHSLSVENLYGICFEETVNILNEDEKFLLIVATLLHDVGMVGDSRFLNDADYGENIRSSHNQRSADFIDDYRRDLGLDTKEADAIKRIASSHRKVPLDSVLECEPYGQGGSIRVRLLSALIRLADELDILEERAPYLVKEYLGISNESLIHHERHEVMTGINRINRSICIKAVAPNEKLENAIKEMFEEILKKYSDVNLILKSNNINVDEINIIIDVSKIIEKELLIFIAKNNKVSDEMIYKNFLGKREEKVIDAVIIDLQSRKYMIYNKDEHVFTLNDNMNSFKEFIKLFIGSNLELQFTNSVYVKEFLKKHFTVYVNDNFGVLYDEGDRDDRIEILTHFPTSLKYFVDERNTPYEFGNADRRVTLDYGLLHAFSIDVLKYPNELTEDSFYAIQSIEKSLNENSLNFFKLMETISKVKKN